MWVTLRRILFGWTGFWSGSNDYLKEEPVDPWNILMCTTLFILMLSGIRRALQEHNPLLAPFLLTLAIYPVVHYLTIYQPLYRQPIDPVIVILAAYGSMELASDYQNIRSKMREEPRPTAHPLLVQLNLALFMPQRFRRLESGRLSGG